MSGAQVGHSAVVHNYLSHVDIETLNQKLRACKPDDDACKEKAREWARQRDKQNSAALDACKTDECRLAHAIAIKRGSEAIYDIGNEALSSVSGLRYEITSMNAGDSLKISQNVRAVATVLAFALDNCSGAWNDKCLSKWRADQSRQSAEAKWLITAIFGPAAVASGVGGVALLRTCMMQAPCIHQLAMGAMEIGVGDALGGASLAGGAASVAKLGGNAADALRASEKLADDAVAAALKIRVSVPKGADWFEDVARSATRNPGSDRLVLGHFSGDGVSYQKVAAHYEATYFKVDDWNAVTKDLSQDEIWMINETFLVQQLRQGKQILFSHNPESAKLGSFFEREVNFMRELGYDFRQKNQWTWEAFK